MGLRAMKGLWALIPVLEAAGDRQESLGCHLLEKLWATAPHRLAGLDSLICSNVVCSLRHRFDPVRFYGAYL